MASEFVKISRGFAVFSWAADLNTILFDEWDRARTLDLTEAEIEKLLLESYAFDMQRLSRTRLRVRPRGGRVGTVRLSRETQLQVRPKVPIAALFALFSLAYGAALPTNSTGDAELAAGNPAAWLAALFLDECARLLRRGLRRGYVDVVEATGFVRGRLSPSHLYALPTTGMPVCEYSDFSLDSPENRALRVGVEIVLSLAIGDRLRIRARSIKDELGEITYSAAAAQNIQTIRLTPLNQHYARALHFVRLLSQARGIDFLAGSVETPAFFLQLHDVFERAIYAALRHTVSNAAIIRHPSLRRLVRFVSGTPNRGLEMIPDYVAVRNATLGIVDSLDNVLLVVDAKYRKPVELSRYRYSFRNRDVYQVMMYANALSCNALLLYPQFEEAIDVRYRVGGRELRIRTVDLGKAELEGLWDVSREVALEIAPSV